MLLSKDEVVNKEGVGVVIGRFQPLTEGHQDIIQTVIDRHQKTIVVVGISEIRYTQNNPLDYEMRRRLIYNKFPNVHIVYNNDHPSDEVWSRKLDKLISSNIPPGSNVTLYGSRDNFSSHYSGSYKVVELIQDRYVSGTAEREKLSYRVSDHEEFINGMVCSAQNQYPTAYCAVDVAIVDKKLNRVLLGRKDNQNKFRFVGGFVEPSTEAYDGNFLEINAKREVVEETGLEVGQLKYIGSFLIDDWRYRSEKNKIFSAFFTAEYVFGKAEPNDDIYELRWFDINNLKEKEIVGEHVNLLKTLVSSFDKGGQNV